MIVQSTEDAALIVPALLSYAANRRDLDPNTALRASMLAARIALEHMHDPLADQGEEDD